MKFEAVRGFATGSKVQYKYFDNVTAAVAWVDEAREGAVYELGTDIVLYSKVVRTTFV